MNFAKMLALGPPGHSTLLIPAVTFPIKCGPTGV